MVEQGVLLREALGAGLRYARTEQHRTLREISTSARVSLGYLSEVERGQKEASSELLAAICDALDIELADLLIDAGTALRANASIPVPVVMADSPLSGRPVVASSHEHSDRLAAA